MSVNGNDRENETSFYASVDRIERAYAILIVDGKPIQWPLALLPPSLKEGQVLLVSARIDAARTQEVKRHVSDLLKRLRSRTD